MNTSPTIDLSMINPYIIRSSFFYQGKYFDKGERLSSRYVYDFELEFFTFSEGYMLINDVRYDIQKGDVIFRRPGDLTQAIMPYVCYYIAFDLVGNAKKDGSTYDFDHPMPFQPNYTHSFLSSIPTKTALSSDHRIGSLFDDLLKQYANPSPVSQLKQTNLLMQILILLYEENTIASTYVEPYNPYKTMLDGCISYIENHYAEKITLKDLTCVADMSDSHFIKIFTSHIGETPINYINRVRVNHARELLITSNMPITDIGLNCGFENPSYFSTVFKNYTGYSPRLFKKQYAYLY